MILQSAAAVAIAVLAGLASAGWLVGSAPPERQFTDYTFAPPMLPRVIDADGRLRAPFVYPIVLESRLERRYAEDRARPMPLRWMRNGALVSVDPGQPPWFALGTDGLGRDVYARLARGARVSLGVALLAAAGALLIGAVLGAVAGFAGGLLDDALMRAADFIIALPAIYVVLTLRAALPLVLTPGQVFWVMVLVFAGVGWPIVARGVRAVVMVEAAREYAESARAIGASRVRILMRHLLPAARGFLMVQAAVLVPAFVLAEATLSFVGLGFGEPTPSWGLMLQEASRGRTLVEAPWLLAPAVSISGVVLAITILTRTRRTRGASLASWT